MKPVTARHSLAAVALATLAGACGEAPPGLPQGARAPNGATELPSVMEAHAASAQSEGTPSAAVLAANVDVPRVRPRVQLRLPASMGAFGPEVPGDLRPVEPESDEAESDAQVSPPAFTESGALSHGDVCTYGAEAWGAPCGTVHEGAGCLRDAHWTEVVADGSLRVGASKVLSFTSPSEVEAALPGSGPAERLTADVTNPGSTGLDPLGSEVVALRMNLSFSAERLMGSLDTRALFVAQGRFTGWRVEDVYRFAESVYSGDRALISAVGMDLEMLATELRSLNNAAPDCAAPAWLTR
jgi:hypothetical protein